MQKENILNVQRRLNQLGYDAGPTDGSYGKRTIAAVKLFQSNNGLSADGIVGRLTNDKLFSHLAKPYAAGRPPVAMYPKPTQSGAPSWPSEAQMGRVFGQPGNPKCTAGKVQLPIPFKLAWDLDERISRFSCHELVAAPLERIFLRAVEHYGEADFRRLGLDLFGGCYSPRTKRGGSSWSTHAYGIAYDVDPERNQLKWGRDKAQLARLEYEAFWGFVESEGAISLGRHSNYDWMHFQFARL